MQKQQIIIVACVVFGVFFAEVLMPFIIEIIIEREKKKPHQLSWQMSLLIILFVLTAFGLIFIL